PSPTIAANSQPAINVSLNVISSSTPAVSPASLLFTQTAGGAAPASQTVSVTSSSGVLTFSAIATTNQGGGWLSVTPNNATTPGTLTVSVNGGGLPASPIPYTGQIV